MENKLGNIKRVPLREIWSNEAQHFTPWLAKDENIRKLADHLGLELEIENTEVSVGPYSADILAKNVGTGRYVVIENQLEKTDHDHLGKSITYASVLDAEAIIWIASTFTEEHKRALDWLNEHSDENLSFYGIEIQLIKVDDSKPAIVYNLISKPLNAERQTAKAAATDDLSDSRRLQLDFWVAVRNELEKTKRIPSLQTPRPQYWFDISLGRTNVNLSLTANTYDDKIGIRVYISNKISDVLLPALELEKDAIEKEIGCKLKWNPHPDKMDKIIVLDRDVNLEDRNKWPEYVQWLVDYSIKFREAFSKRVRKF